jgi:thiol:disulfide interchange protein DsbD
LQSGVVFAAMMAALPLCAQIQTAGDGTKPSAQAQHLMVELVPSPVSFVAGGKNVVGLHFKLEPGWHIYWINAGDAGGPTAVEWTLPNGITAGPLLFPAPKRLPLGPLMDFGYEGEVTLPVKLDVAKGAKAGTLQTKVDWLVCREVCIPGKALLGLSYGVSAFGGIVNGPELEMVNAAVKNLPQPLPKGASAKIDASKDAFALTLTTGKRIEHVEVYPFDQGQVANAAVQKVEPLADGARIELVKDDTLTTTPTQMHLLVKLSETLAYDVTVPVSNGDATAAMSDMNATVPAAVAPVQGGIQGNMSAVTLWGAIGLAFLGGIILNLMPCVFPVLFLKGLSLVRSTGEERSRTRKHGLVYTAGIVVSFWVIVAVLLALRTSGARLGWGFQLQSPAFIAVLSCGLFFFALSLAGMFDFGLTLTSAGGELAQKPGYTGSFFTGVLATVVATPCTAPLMGAAIGFALAQPAWMAFVIFTSVALGLAMPYLLLSFQPSWTRLLPKPGAWMEVLKQVTSVPLFATVIWLVWVYGTLRGLDAMTRLLISLLVVAVAAWVMGRWPGKTLAAIVAVILIAAGLAVPLRHREAVSAAWVPYSADGLAAARAEGKPVFVDFTAAWCLSCHVNEEFVLDSSEVQSKLEGGGLVLMKADWTKYDPAITDALASVHRSGVPTYVIYPAHGGQPDVLPELLSKSVVLNALERDTK